VINYCLICIKETKQPIASAFATKEVKTATELRHELEAVSKLPFELTLIKLSENQNGLEKSKDLTGISKVWWDYQPNELGWPLFSEKLKNIINSNLQGTELLTWISAIVASKEEKRNYFIPRFEKQLDVLDFDRTIFVSGTDHIIKPYYLYSKIQKYSVFPKPSSNGLWKITPDFYH
jgi:hypothetical protein